MPNHMEQLLDLQICGFHQYVLADPVHLDFVSQNLCDLTGYARDELLSDAEDRYLKLVHAADREAYCSCIQALKTAEQTLSVQYRLTRRDGTVIWVMDTLSSRRGEQAS